uniref:Uncharacterized protein n=1 Tax=Oryza sativa subsp. japonica TaxID=39947 RepID=Q75HF0_ORYSJ|nr:hypothetical protein [Oryza sativa Japonica Group]
MRARSVSSRTRLDTTTTMRIADAESRCVRVGGRRAHEGWSEGRGHAVAHGAGAWRRASRGAWFGWVLVWADQLQAAAEEASVSVATGRGVAWRACLSSAATFLQRHGWRTTTTSKRDSVDDDDEVTNPASASTKHGAKGLHGGVDGMERDHRVVRWGRWRRGGRGAEVEVDEAETSRQGIHPGVFVRGGRR